MNILGAVLELVCIDELSDGVVKIALNRPQKMNALNLEMFAAIVDAGEKLMGNSKIRAIILHGNGDAFCAGLDLSIMSQFSSVIANLHERTHNDCNIFQRAAMVWHDIEAPVISAIHGVAFGGGLQIASGADIKIAAPDAKLSIMELKWGIIPDMGGTYLWPQSVRADILKDLTMNAGVISSKQALEYGLVTKIANDPIQEAINYALGLKDKNIKALHAQKRLYNSYYEKNRAQQLLNESIEQAKLLKAMMAQ